MKLKSAIYRIVSVDKPTKAEGFADFKEDDLIVVHGTTDGSSGYVGYVKVENLTQGFFTPSKSELAMHNVMDRAFTLEEASLTALSSAQSGALDIDWHISEEREATLTITDAIVGNNDRLLLFLNEAIDLRNMLDAAIR